MSDSPLSSKKKLAFELVGETNTNLSIGQECFRKEDVVGAVRELKKWQVSHVVGLCNTLSCSNDNENLYVHEDHIDGERICFECVLVRVFGFDLKKEVKE